MCRDMNSNVPSPPTEADRVRRLLSRRATESGAYLSPLPVEGDDLVVILLLDAQVFVSIEEVGGRVTAALSYLVKQGHTSHLNGWRREEGCTKSVPDLVDDIWAAFWAHEKENEGLGRILWMHGRMLPGIGEDITVEQPAQMPLPVLTPVQSTPKRSRSKVFVDQDVLDLFGE